MITYDFLRNYTNQIRERKYQHTISPNTAHKVASLAYLLEDPSKWIRMIAANHLKQEIKHNKHVYPLLWDIQHVIPTNERTHLDHFLNNYRLLKLAKLVYASDDDDRNKIIVLWITINRVLGVIDTKIPREFFGMIVELIGIIEHSNNMGQVLTNSINYIRSKFTFDIKEWIFEVPKVKISIREVLDIRRIVDDRIIHASFLILFFTMMLYAACPYIYIVNINDIPCLKYLDKDGSELFYIPLYPTVIFHRQNLLNQTLEFEITPQMLDHNLQSDEFAMLLIKHFSRYEIVDHEHFREVKRFVKYYHTICRRNAIRKAKRDDKTSYLL